jgi:hypothetical protein
MSIGEGIISAIRDPRNAEDAGGVEDKRIQCIESELGAALRAFQRQGNTLSAILRAAWDGVTLEPLIKTDPIRATDPHVCILAHITREELKQLLSSTDIWNGFVNRLLWAAERRSKIVAFPKPMPDDDVRRIARQLALVVRNAHKEENKGSRR